MKKTSNKGFSLVELIVVIAIMGVLMVVLAPQYLKYVEKSRLQKDNTAIAEIANNIKIAMADEAIAKDVRTTPANGTLKFVSDKIEFPSTGTPLQKELNDMVAKEVELASNTYAKQAADVEFVVDIDANNVFKVYVNNFMEAVNGTPSNSVQF